VLVIAIGVYWTPILPESAHAGKPRGALGCDQN
jgi:hypothetical protein